MFNHYRVYWCSVTWSITYYRTWSRLYPSKYPSITILKLASQVTFLVKTIFPFFPLVSKFPDFCFSTLYPSQSGLSHWLGVHSVLHTLLFAWFGGTVDCREGKWINFCLLFYIIPFYFSFRKAGATSCFFTLILVILPTQFQYFWRCPWQFGGEYRSGRSFCLILGWYLGSSWSGSPLSLSPFVQLRIAK